VDAANIDADVDGLEDPLAVDDVDPDMAMDADALEDPLAVDGVDPDVPADANTMWMPGASPSSMLTPPCRPSVCFCGSACREVPHAG
jgi:hypothetical protein